MSDCFDTARAWVGGHYFLDVTDEEIAYLTNDEAREEIGRLYEGGWDQFLADNGFGTCCPSARRYGYHDHHCSQNFSRSAGS